MLFATTSKGDIHNGCRRRMDGVSGLWMAAPYYHHKITLKYIYKTVTLIWHYCIRYRYWAVLFSSSLSLSFSVSLGLTINTGPTSFSSQKRGILYSSWSHITVVRKSTTAMELDQHTQTQTWLCMCVCVWEREHNEGSQLCMYYSVSVIIFGCNASLSNVAYMHI